MKNILSPLLILFTFCSFAQEHFRFDNLTVINETNDTIKNPFAGGFNAPQFSEIDLNFDGIKDLFVFDRDGEIIKTFINGGTANKIDYKHSNAYWDKFPEMQNFALLRDYDCDGKEDIFTGTSAGMKVYRNTSNSFDGLQFELVTSLVLSDYGNSGLLNLYVPSTDIPAITDMDGDGDLDVLSFGVWGTMVEYHENQSIDLYGSCDSLAFVASTTCWGNFAENSQNNSVTLGTSCKGVVGHAPDSLYNGIHSGSTLLAIDMDADGDKELMLGDISFPNIVALTNGGTNTNANIITQNSAFPSTTTPINLYIFPALYYLDVTNDGIKDLIAAPNAENISENFTSVWFYKNSGTNDAPVFNYMQNDFLQDEMIEVGEGANAVFEDVNQDGLQDLIIGNYGYYGNPDFTSSIAYYENVGQTNEPIFKLIDRDYGGFSAINTNGLFPAFGDVDSDGDNDLMIGSYDGDLYLYENIAGAGNPYSFTLFAAQYMGIDIGQHAAPQLVDFNGDGLLDLIIGERAGNINYYENKGTPTDPNHSIQNTTEFGQIDVMPLCCTGYSTVHLTRDENNDRILYVGSEQGIVYIYTDIDTLVPDAPFTLTDSIVTGATSVSIFTADITGDGIYEELYAENSGGVTVLRTTSQLQLVYPANGSINVPYDVVLDWKAAPELATTYEYFIDTLIDFSSPLFNSGQTTYLSDASNGPDTEQQITLLLNQHYYWKARYFTSSDTSEWSQTWEFTVTEDSVTIANFEADFTEITPTSTIQFTDLSSSNPTSWEWTFDGGIPTSSTAQHPQVTYNNTGTYDVQLIATNAFGVDTILKENYINVDLNNSVESLYDSDIISIYPNPASDLLTITSKQTLDKVFYRVIDINGRVLREENLSENTQNIDIRFLPAGVYFIQVNGEDNLYRFKFVKI